ncbi:hypothetical protein Godav_000966, partial [Gossypium davidsonii]|nr:hypothetical protein [Gossypium davidsonii]
MEALRMEVFWVMLIVLVAVF